MVTKFYFHLRHGENFVEDRVGIDIPDVETAHRQSTCAINEMLIEGDLTEAAVDNQSIEVCDENGHMFFSVSFKPVLTDDSDYVTGRNLGSFYLSSAQGTLGSRP